MCGVITAALSLRRCEFYAIGRSCAIGLGLILLSWFVRQEEERTGGAPRNESGLNGVAGEELSVSCTHAAMGIEEVRGGSLQAINRRYYTRLTPFFMAPVKNEHQRGSATVLQPNI
jgi:hypothetical protein